jgi:hypothetical protein
VSSHTAPTYATCKPCIALCIVPLLLNVGLLFYIVSCAHLLVLRDSSWLVSMKQVILDILLGTTS